MAEELQNLLDRIQRDGVEKAEAQAAQIVADAETKAAEITAEAEAQAQATTQNGEQEAAAFLERAQKSLEQAARDIMLSIGDAVTNTMQSLTRNEVNAALTPEALEAMLVKLVESYCAREDGAAGLDILLGAEDCNTLAQSLQTKLGEKLEGGVDLVPDKSVVSGFRVAVKGQHVEHDFTGQAIADAMSELLRPRIAEIVQNAIKQEG
jgi:V/A-type H+-transporting ATPase subunit E